MRRLAVPLCATLVAGCYINIDSQFPETNLGAPDTCFNNALDDGELDVDCGGDCPLCETGQFCRGATDCFSTLCIQSACRPQTCTNESLDPGESDVDCGGDCTPCRVGEACAQPPDCITGWCSAFDHTCVATSCEDAAVSGDETDLDCGGSCADDCAVGAGCAVAGDCTSGFCNGTTGICVATSCEDDVKSGDETGTNCGNACGLCPVGEGCLAPDDCALGLCNVADGICVATTCEDDITNGTETDLNCGGACPPCGTGQGCQLGTDCAGGVCQPDNTCNCAPCPAEMTKAPGMCLCIDNYETSVFDDPACDGSGTQYGVGVDDYPIGFPRLVTSAGYPGGITIGGNFYALVDQSESLYACSIAGVTPSGYLSWFQARRVCENIGKRMCEPGEWVNACLGDALTTFPYGPDHVPGACNDHNVVGAPSACGAFQDCHSAGSTASVYDLSGNVVEWIDACTDSSCHAAGGFYTGETNMSECTGQRDFPPNVASISDYHGARCCLSP